MIGDKPWAGIYFCRRKHDHNEWSGQSILWHEPIRSNNDDVQSTPQCSKTAVTRNTRSRARTQTAWLSQLRSTVRVATQGSRTKTDRGRSKRAKISIRKLLSTECSAGQNMDLTWARLGKEQYTWPSKIWELWLVSAHHPLTFLLQCDQSVNRMYQRRVRFAATPLSQIKDIFSALQIVVSQFKVIFLKSIFKWFTLIQSTQISFRTGPTLSPLQFSWTLGLFHSHLDYCVF